MYFTQYCLPPGVRISCCSIIIHVMMIYKPFFKLSILNCNSYIVILFVMSRSLRKQDILVQCNARKQDNVA